ncbi:alpha/beta fold hydrolase [Roseibium marinum]|uniref:Pimeloyl-ACP methyl ester carboxylesterase n=1 Tax=Roseibium marinum TaxID=281252 RepID=A0A2S3URX8_9HYPH|nr:alpha/beta fold hydrolase [Roseibium marinum]POF30414.1 pimeloyl-ACP methyl ester carboxylesterase [Roseibium marinum]
MSDPIVFVPGLLCTEALFAPQIVAFADRPIMVANHREQDSIEAIAAKILEKAPERFSLIGLSMGGYICMEIMREAPERVGKLALLDTNARPDSPDQSERRKFLIDLTRKKGFSKVPHLLYPGFVHEKREEDAALKQIVVDMAMETGPEAFIRQQTALIDRIDARPRLSEIDCPTLVLVGDGDRLTPPPVSREIHERISGSDLVLIEGSGHLSTLEEPDRTTATLRDFLNRP